MSVKMRKAGQRDCDVSEDAVANFESKGWARCDGSAAPEPEAETGGGLSDSEKQSEIDASCKIVREAGEAAGLDDEEIDANVEAERERITAELG